MPRVGGLVVAGSLVLAACSAITDAPAPQGEAVPPSPVAAPPDADPLRSIDPATDTALMSRRAAVVISPVDDDAPGWSEAFVIPYGDEPEAVANGLMEALLGSVAGKADYGPSLATVDSRGRWWVADQYKSRIARYTADGAYIDSISVEATAPLEALEVFDDGTAVGLTTDRRWVVVSDDRAFTVAADRDVVFTGNDGSAAYGWSLYGRGVESVEVADGGLPAGREVRWFRTRTGSAFGIEFTGDDELRITLPDARIRLTLDVLAETGQPVFVSTEFDTDEAGNLHLLLLGHVIADPLRGDEPDLRFTTRAAHVVVSPQGEILADRAVPDPYGAWDFGVQQRFSVRPDTGTAHIVTVQPDGVHVWQTSQSWAATAAVVPGDEVTFPPDS